MKTTESKQKMPLLNVLLAEDDKDDRFFFEKALNELPISSQLKTVNDGEELMKYLVENLPHLPDVLFLDLNMPRKNGFECLTEIKRNDKLKNLSVVMFSTSYPPNKNTEWDMVNILIRMGAYHYIHKPENFAQLKQSIHHALIMAVEKKSSNGEGNNII